MKKLLKEIKQLKYLMGMSLQFPEPAFPCGIFLLSDLHLAIKKSDKSQSMLLFVISCCMRGSNTSCYSWLSFISQYGRDRLTKDNEAKSINY